ncbi:adenylate kinase [Malassezia cuniculi]|uniref:XTP/dITP diphosphatase n=1 Tax=Malassezia cuniculi TaxID=948313 RepID=A0AAF0ENS4_9BASI|nr:adenylate kinase [Malassezia cuniculi]
MSERVVTFVTGNANKLREAQQILARANVPWKLESRSVDVPEIQGTTQEVAIAKCSAAARAIGGPCLTEDTALCFRALGGLPGPYIKHFLGNVGVHGLHKLLAGFEDKSATALCTFAFCSGPDAEPILFEGTCEGKIVAPRGETDFGWDPVIEIDGTGKTFSPK